MPSEDLDEVQSCVLQKAMRESLAGVAVPAFWCYVQDVVRKYRYINGFVDWDLVKKQVNQELVKVGLAK
jgi:hypothetical protein